MKNKNAEILKPGGQSREKIVNFSVGPITVAEQRRAIALPAVVGRVLAEAGIRFDDVLSRESDDEPLT